MEMTGKRDEVHGIDREKGWKRWILLPFCFFFGPFVQLAGFVGMVIEGVYRWKSKGGKSQRRRETIREEKESEERCRCAKR